MEVIELKDGRKKIVKCTDLELYDYWLKRWSDFYSYDDYKRRCIANGMEVKDDK